MCRLLIHSYRHPPPRAIALPLELDVLVVGQQHVYLLNLANCCAPLPQAVGDHAKPAVPLQFKDLFAGLVEHGHAAMIEAVDIFRTLCFTTTLSLDNLFGAYIHNLRPGHNPKNFRWWGMTIAIPTEVAVSHPLLDLAL